MNEKRDEFFDRLLRTHTIEVPDDRAEFWKQAYIEEHDARIEEIKGDRHKAACIIADLFGDNCACNFNAIDEWLPMYCDFAETECPNPGGVTCWEQYLKYLNKKDEPSTSD